MTAGLEPPDVDRALGTEERAAELAALLQADAELQQLAAFVDVAESEWPPDICALAPRSPLPAESASQFLQRWWLLFEDEVSLVHQTRNRLVHQLPVSDAELLRARWWAMRLIGIVRGDT